MVLVKEVRTGALGSVAIWTVAIVACLGGAMVLYLGPGGRFAPSPSTLYTALTGLFSLNVALWAAYQADPKAHRLCVYVDAEQGAATEDHLAGDCLAFRVVTLGRQREQMTVTLDEVWTDVPDLTCDVLTHSEADVSAAEISLPGVFRVRVRPLGLLARDIRQRVPVRAQVRYHWPWSGRPRCVQVGAETLVNFRRSHPDGA